MKHLQQNETQCQTINMAFGASIEYRDWGLDVSNRDIVISMLHILRVVHLFVCCNRVLASYSVTFNL